MLKLVILLEEWIQINHWPGPLAKTNIYTNFVLCFCCDGMLYDLH
jgi:hypothetical protein